MFLLRIAKTRQPPGRINVQPLEGTIEVLLSPRNRSKRFGTKPDLHRRLGVRDDPANWRERGGDHFTKKKSIENGDEAFFPVAKCAFYDQY